MANKNKNKYGNPQKNIEAEKAIEAAKLTKEAERVAQHKSSDKPLIMRIIVIALVAVMIFGFVIASAVR